MTRATASMLVQAPRAAAFRAFTSRREICRFWLDAASADLEPGATVEWTFMVPGARETVRVLAIEPDEAIRFRWSDGRTVALSFAEHASGGTVVSVEVTGIEGEGAVAAAIDATEGFAIVLADLKVLLERGASPGLVRAKATLIAERMAEGRKA